MLGLLHVSIMTFKEAKRTFLTPSRMILIIYSSGIIKFDPNEAPCKFLKSYLVGKCSGPKLAAFVNLGSIVLGG